MFVTTVSNDCTFKKILLNQNLYSDITDVMWKLSEKQNSERILDAYTVKRCAVTTSDYTDRWIKCSVAMHNLSQSRSFLFTV